MNSIRIAIVGYGNIGRGVRASIRNNPDTELAGILTRGPARVREELSGHDHEIPPIVDAGQETDFAGVCPADVAILCGGSKDDLPEQGPKFAAHYSVVDSFDTHARISEYYRTMDEVASDHDHIAVVSTGWDPGTFSEERVKADAFLPGACHYTFWGPGVSQGHSDAVRQIDGVRDARQYTLPLEEMIERVRNGEPIDESPAQRHKRMVYVVAEEDADTEEIEREIRQMPHYFEPYETEVEFIPLKQMKQEHSDMPHGGFVMATGRTGEGHRALIEYRCEWGNNPEATANILVAHARAAHRMNGRGESGARTILQIPPADLSPHSHDELLENYM